jgi:hypothetical protein
MIIFKQLFAILCHDIPVVVSITLTELSSWPAKVLKYRIRTSMRGDEPPKMYISFSNNMKLLQSIHLNRPCILVRVKRTIRPRTHLSCRTKNQLY